MTKTEFEKLAMRNDKSISGLLYERIENFYISENDYHAANGGINESKQDFVKRVFGGKVNTPATIVKKTIIESQKENRYCLLGIDITPERLAEMDYLIADHINTLAKYDY